MSTNTTTTSTVVAHAQPEADMTILAPAILYTSLMMLMGACGNAVVCYVYGFRWQSTVTKVFIFSLALLDLSNSLICMPTEIVMLVKIVSFDSPTWCKLSRFLTYTLNGSSSLILVSIALDRWYKVCKPMKHFFTIRRAKLTCAGAMVLAASVSWPALVLYGNLTVAVAGSDVMGVTCLVSDDFIDTWWPLVFYSLYFAMYMVLVVAITVLYSLIAVRIVQLKKRQKARLMSPVACTGLRSSRLCSTSQELVLVEASHHHHDNNNDREGGGGGGKCGVKIQMINEEAELLEEDTVQSALACVEVVPRLERIQEEIDRRRSVSFRLPRHSGTAENNLSGELSGDVPQDESKTSQSASADETGDSHTSRSDAEKTVHSHISRGGADKTVDSCGLPMKGNSSTFEQTIQAHPSDSAQSPNGPCVPKNNDESSNVEVLGDQSQLQSHPKQDQLSAKKQTASKSFQNGERVAHVDYAVDNSVDNVTLDDCETKPTTANLSVPYLYHEDNRLLSRLSSHSHTDSPDEDTDSYEQGIHFVSQSEICWQHNPIAEPVVINNDVRVTDDVSVTDVVNGEFSVTSDVKDVVINHDVSVLQDESVDEPGELGTSAVWLLGDATSRGGKTKLNKTMSDTAALSAHTARNGNKKKKVHKTVSESQASLQVPAGKQPDGGCSSRSSFLLPPGGYPGGHTPTSRLPTPTGTSTPDAADNRPVRLSGALLLERLNKKMAYRPAKTTRMLFAISIVFVLSFLPFFCIVITRAVRGKAFLTSLTDAGVVLISIFIRSSFLSNAANPIIYGLCNKQFRTECRRLARRVSGKEHGVTLRVIEQTDDALGSENS